MSKSAQKKKKWTFRIDDMLDAITGIEHSSSDHSSEDSLYNDIESYRAVERNLQIIADASKHLPEEIKAQFTEIAWQKIVDMRNFLVHEYDAVDELIIWKVIKDELPSLKTVLLKMKGIYKT